MPSKAKNFGTDIRADIGQLTLLRVLHEQLDKRGVDELRKVLETDYGEQVWDSEQLLEVFEISHFEPPYVHVIRKIDGLRGTVAFNDNPRFYFAFRPEGGIKNE